MRAAVLAKMDLDPQGYIGTSVASSTLVDIARMTVYGISYFTGHFAALGEGGLRTLILAGIGSAFVGAFLGSRWMKSVTMEAIRTLVGVMLLLLAVALGSGLV